MTLSRLSAAEAARGDGVLRFADYHGMDEAVTETANEALAGLEASAREQLPDLIAGLVRDVAADPLTGAPTPVIGALDRARFEAGRPERTALVEAFVAKRLLTAEGDAASQRVRPTHEALLRIWPEAVAIIAEAAHLIRVRHALEPIAREWAEAPSEDKARHLDISPALLDGAQRYVAALRRGGVARRRATSSPRRAPPQKRGATANVKSKNVASPTPRRSPPPTSASPGAPGSASSPPWRWRRSRAGNGGPPTRREKTRRRSATAPRTR